MPNHCYLHNQLLCNSIKVIYCRWGMILFCQGRTQGDSTAMGAYALGILPLIKFQLEFINLNEMNAKEIVFADDFSVAGSLKDYWDKLTGIAPKYSCFPKSTKSYLIVKEKRSWKCKTYLLIQE